MLLFVNVAVHEIAHALACLIFHLEIDRVSIGAGPSLKIRKLSVGVIPIGGGVRFRYETLSRLQRYVIFLSGPLATVLLLAWYASADQDVLHRLLVVQLIAQLAVSLLPARGSDLSNALEMRRKTDE